MPNFPSKNCNPFLEIASSKMEFDPVLTILWSFFIPILSHHHSILHQLNSTLTKSFSSLCLGLGFFFPNSSKYSQFPLLHPFTHSLTPNPFEISKHSWSFFSFSSSSFPKKSPFFSLGLLELKWSPTELSRTFDRIKLFSDFETLLRLSKCANSLH